VREGRERQSALEGERERQRKRMSEREQERARVQEKKYRGRYAIAPWTYALQVWKEAADGARTQEARRLRKPKNNTVLIGLRRAPSPCARDCPCRNQPCRGVERHPSRRLCARCPGRLRAECSQPRTHHAGSNYPSCASHRG